MSSVLCGITVATFAAPTLFMIIIYSKIYLEAHNSSERSRKCSLKPSDTIHSIALSGSPKNKLLERCIQGMEPPAIIPGRMRRSSTSSCVQKSDINNQRKASLPSYLGHMRHRISNAGQFIHREEGKTAKIYIISMSAVIFCWGPLFANKIVNIFLNLSLSSWSSFLIIFPPLTYPVLSPFIFAFRNRKVRRKVLNMIGIESGEDHLPPSIAFPVPRIYHNLTLAPSRFKSDDNLCKALRIYESDKEGEKSFHTNSASSSSSSISTKLSVTCTDVLEGSC